MSQHGCPERLSNMSKGFQEEGTSQPTMEVLVETLTGTVFEMTVSPSDTIFAIKSKIFRVEGIPVSQQHLVYNLRELEDSLSLREHAIADGARLRLVLGMRVGPIATRRLPPPPAVDAWRDLDRLLDNNREEGEWTGSGCKVTVLVFREGERVNMLRVRENRDGTYSPLDHTKYSSSASPCGSRPAERPAAPAENAVTAGKMLDLRRRMESLSLQRRRPLPRPGDKAEIQKTRSEETLSVPSLLDETSEEPFESRTYTPYSEAEDTFAPLYDGNYTRYDYDCSFADRYTFLPPIGARTDSDQSVQEAVAESDRLKLTDALAGSILVKGGRRDGREDEAAILEECLDGAAVEECHIRQDSPQLAAKNLAPIPAAEYGPLVGGESGWRARGFGSSSQLAAPAPLARAPPAHSASALQLRAPAPRHPPPRPAALSDALFSSSTSDLEHLTRNRLLPTLSRHRNREHLHLSDEGLDTARTQNLDIAADRPGRIKKIAEFDSTDLTKFAKTPVEDKKEKTKRIRCGFCKKRLSIATVHKCRCGAEFCAPHRYAEVHGCAYDYKANAHQYLERANPLVSAPKLPKI